MTQAICDAIREKLSALVDGDLAPADRAEVEDHLRGCAACETEARALRETLQALRNLPRPEPPPDLLARIDRAIDAAPSRPARGRSRVRRHAVAVALVLGLVVGIIRVIPHGPALFGGRRPPLPVEKKSEVAVTAPASQAAPTPLAPSNQAPAPKVAGSIAGQEAATAETDARSDLAKEKRAEPPMAERKALGALSAGAGAPPPPPPSAPPQEPAPIDVLRHPRPDPGWVESVRRLVTDRPEELARAWKGITAREQSEVLAAWARSARAPGLAGDLDGALGRAKDPDVRIVLHALREFTP